MAILKVDYPDVLTKASWNSHKGIIAKLAVGKTDLGPKLADVESAFRDGGFPTVAEFEGIDLAEYEAFEKNLVADLEKGGKAIGVALAALKPVATAAHEALQESKVVPKSTTAYVKSVLDQIKPFKALVTQYPEVVTQSLRKAYKKKLRASRGYLAAQGFASTGAKLHEEIIKLVRQVEADPTLARVHKVFSDDGPHRQLTTSFKAWDQLVKRDFPTLTEEYHAGKAMSMADLPFLSDVANENNHDASSKLQALVEAGQDEAQVVEKFCLKYSGSVMQAQGFLAQFVACFRRLESF